MNEALDLKFGIEVINTLVNMRCENMGQALATKILAIDEYHTLLLSSIMNMESVIKPDVDPEVKH